MIAHRGAWDDDRRENTLSAFERAIELGADMIEFDVRRTRDGQLVIFHDAEIRGSLVSALTREELGEISGELPPVLSEVLALADRRIAVVVELKEDVVDDVVAPLLDFQRRGGWLIAISAHEEVLAHLARRAPALRGGLILEGSAAYAVARARACSANALLPEIHLATESLLAELDQAGFDTFVWRFLAHEHGELLLDRRVAWVITDDVPGALAARADRYGPVSVAA